jgi:hypothetical protein
MKVVLLSVTYVSYEVTTKQTILFSAFAAPWSMHEMN